MSQQRARGSLLSLTGTLFCLILIDIDQEPVSLVVACQAASAPPRTFGVARLVRGTIGAVTFANRQ
jgi:hypothetical protein